MNEPFSEKSARQIMRQSGQLITQPQDNSVSAQSVSPQSRYANGQKNYQMNHSANRPAASPMNSQSPRKELYQENGPANRFEENYTEQQSCELPGSGQILEQPAVTGKTEELRNKLNNASTCASPDGARKTSAAAARTPAEKNYTVAYQAATPYPPIQVNGQNPQYAAAMLDNMSGKNSELSAVGLYFNDHLLTTGYNDVSETFHHMNIVEMRHLEIFAKLAMQLGENPRFWSRQPRSGRYIYWNPACIHYPNVQPPTQKGPISQACLRLILSQAIECEQAAIRKYMQQTTWIQDVNICDNLRRISADEQMHVDILTRLYHNI